MNTIKTELRSMGLVANIYESQIDIEFLDQTRLPFEEKWVRVQTLLEMLEAIRALRIRGAPLIGVAASLMLAKLACELKNSNSYFELLLDAANQLNEARPTAVNLMNCMQRMKTKIAYVSSYEGDKNFERAQSELKELAVQIFIEDELLCRKIAENGNKLISDGDQILTHCNTGGLATSGIGTALGILRLAHQQNKKIHVYIDETRPLLQGARLTAWELKKLGIPCTLITDSMAAVLMKNKKINKAIVGADRIAINGDFANKIGTYSVAVNCFHHQIPFFVAAPYTTVDFNCLDGIGIPIEQRNANEVRGFSGPLGQTMWAPEGVEVFNPAFDVTTANLVTAWILDKGCYWPADVQRGAFRNERLM